MSFHSNKLLYRGSNRNKGASLLVTVLIGLIAASIAVTIIKTSLESSRDTLSKRAEDIALNKAIENIEVYKNKLKVDPLEFLKKVDEFELPRVCLFPNNEGDNILIESGEVWPGYCSVKWSYNNTDDNDYIQIFPPNKDGDYLVIKSFVTTGGVKVGYEEKLIAKGNLFSFISEGNLPLLKKGSGYISIENSGFVNGNADLSGGVYINESNLLVNGVALNNINTGLVVDKNSELYEYSTKYFFNKGDLRSKYLSLQSIGCINNSEMINLENTSSDLCIKKNITLKDHQNVSHSIPEYVDKILIIPESASKDRLEIYYSNNSIKEINKCNIENCSLRSEALNSASHPSNITNWTFLGSFNIPYSGIIYSDFDLYLGLCGPGGLTSTGSCDTSDDIVYSGLEPDNNYIFMAGSISKPKDIYITAPINEGDGNVTIFSSGSIYIPFWASASDNLLKIYADILSLGYNDYLLSTIPFVSETNINNYISNVEIKGSIALGDGDINIIGINNLTTISKASRNKYIGSTGLWESLEKNRINNRDIP